MFCAKVVICLCALPMILAGVISSPQQNQERQTTLLLIGIDGSFMYYVDLNRNTQTKEENLHWVSTYGTSTVNVNVGQTYAATLSSEGRLISIRINDSDMGVASGKNLLDFKNPLSSLMFESCRGHWEWNASAKVAHVCASGPRKAVKADKSRTQTTNLPPCDEQEGFHNTTLTIVTSVKPAEGFKWTMDDAPSFFAAALLDDLNKNKNNITFREANGVKPNFYVNVTMSQTHEGTQQNQVWIEFVGKGDLSLKASSGESPFNNMRDAFSRATSDTLKFFELGWHRTPPCVKRDGFVLNK